MTVQGALRAHMRVHQAARVLTSLLRGSAVALCLLCFSIAPSGAVEIILDFYSDPGMSPNRDYINQHYSEHIDPFSGSLQIHSTDIHLPSRGGFELNVIRSYNTAALTTNSINNDSSKNPSPFLYSSQAGLGWQIHFGRILSKSAAGFGTTYCTVNNTGSTNANPVLELPDGSRQSIYNGKGSFSGAEPNATLITKQRWRVECADSGNSFVVFSPDGMRYDMKQAVSESDLGAMAFYTTKITDRNGNAASINYTTPSTIVSGTFGPTVNPGTAVISNVVTAEITLNFYYEALKSYEYHPRISRISGPGSLNWYYNYTLVTTVCCSDAYFLTKVTRPDNSYWQYSYNDGTVQSGQYMMKKMTFPQGGAIQYDYSLKSFDANNANVQNNVVTKKTAINDGNAYWTYVYTPGSSGVLDKTVVTQPNNLGQITYEHFGPNYGGTNPVWPIGLLAKKTISGTLQTETYTWDKQEISGQPDFRPGQFYLLSDTATFAPLLTKKVIARDGGSSTYTTTYPLANYDAYGNPGLITEAGPQVGNRSTVLTYYVNTSAWIVKQKKDESFYDVILPTGQSFGTNYVPYSKIQRTFDGYPTSGFSSPVLGLRIITQDGVTTSYPARYSWGDIQTMTDPLGNVTTYSNYVCGIPQNESHPEGVNISRVVNTLGNVTSETDGEGHKHGYGYDGLNRLTSITYPIHNSTGITYTVNDTVKTATRGGLVETTNYDSYGRPIKVTLNGITTTYTPDVLGRTTFASNPGATAGTTFAYDILNRVTKIMNADTSFKKFTYAGNVTTVTDERNNATTNTYRSYGDPDKQYLMSITSPVASMSTTIARNGRDLMTSVTQNGVTRIYDYDPANGYYLTSVTNPETAPNPTTYYGRDAAGNMKSKTVGALVTTYGYDTLNRLKTITYPSTNTPTVTKTYTNTNKLKTVSSSVATRTYNYDPNDNLATETLDVIDGTQSFTAIYGYDGNDKLSSLTYPTSGLMLSYTPDSLGRPTTATIPSTTYISGVSYWPSGQVNQITYGNGTTSTYGQDALRLWPTSFVAQKSNTTPYIQNSYGYYPTGDLSSINDPDSNYTRGLLDYDGAGRLITVNGPWGAGSIAYDGNGNIANQKFGTSQLIYTPDANGRLASVVGSGGYTRNTSFGYDSYGNVATADGNTFGYDDAPNLVSFNFGRPNEIDYQYDGANMRVLTNKAGVKTYEFYASNGNLLQEYTPSNHNLLLEYIYLGSKRIAQRAKNDTVAGVTLTSSTNPILLGQPTTLTAVVGGTVTPTGGVTFYDNGVPLGTVQLANGQAQLAVTLSGAGTHSITANYGGDTSNSASTSSVFAQSVKVNSSTSISGAPNPSIVGQAVTLTTTISGSGNASGTVTFSNNGSFLGSTSVINNVASLTLNNLAIGYYSITAAYSGDTANFASTTASPYYLAVNDLTQSSTSVLNPPTIVGINHLVRAFNVQVQGLHPSGQVTISEGGPVLATAALVYDSVSQNYYALINNLTFTTLGMHTLTAQYAGDASNKPSSAQFTINVVPIDPSVLSVILQLLLD